MFIQVHCFTSEDLNESINFINNNFEFEVVEAVTYITTSIKFSSHRTDKLSDPELIAYLAHNFSATEDNIGLYFKPDEKQIRLHIYKSAKINPQNY